MKKTICLILFQLLLAHGLLAQETNEKEVLENLLHQFLEGASGNDAEVHDRFWAEDLIYTSSNGERVTKKDIMDGLKNNEEDTMNSETPRYHAEEIQVKVFDNMSVIAFKLVAVSNTQRGEETMEFYNTGTFQKRNGEWKAVAWQATRIPED